ncbi:MAG: hypothetical protein JWQ09_3799 [Segetibacter sp.]|nr:hypothetical protein [Segetibacter sp.]
MVTTHSEQIQETSANTRKNQGSFFRPVVQTKLTVNEPGDEYEQEADAIADKVMRVSVPGSRPFFNPISNIQRKCQHCEKEEKLHRKEMSTEATNADNALESYVSNLSQAGSSLPNEVRSFYEPRFEYDFSNVKIHTDSIASKSAQSINALAYTSGNNIVFNSGQYSPETDTGKRLLGHELTHVVQQNGYDISKAPIMKKGLYGGNCESAPSNDEEREEEHQESSKEIQAKHIMRKAFESTSSNRYHECEIFRQKNPSGTTIVQRFTLTDFPAAEEAQMRTAIPVAASTVTSCKGLKKTVVEKINNATYLYKPDLGLCGKTYPAPWADIRIGSDAFNFQKCCTLASTIAHEASHTQFYTEGQARQLECSCFNCSC